MATFNTIGGKYAIRTLSAVGTTTVTIATATFVAGDFGTTQRIVALFDSSNVFKGIAWVRQFISTTQLQLENRFVDPVTGLFATQTTTDQILVSKVPNEVTVTGITYDVTTRSSSLTSGWEIGTANSQVSACIYAENTKFAMTDGIMVSGGVVVFGKLLSYDGVSKESFVWNRECSLEPLSTFSGAGAGSYNYSVLRPNSSGCNFFMFGGNVGGSYQSSNFMGIVGAGNGGRSFAFYGTRQNYGCTSPSNGTTWGANAARHLLYKCSFEATYGNANLIMWGDGTWEGGNIAFPQYVSGPLGAFRANGTSAYAAPSGVRALVSDLGQGALIDGITTSTYNFTNLITPAVNSVRTGSAGASTIVANFYFQDDFTNLKIRSTIVVRRTVDSVIATSVANISTSLFSAKVLQASYTSTTTGNLTQTANYTSFDYTIKCYGYNVLSGTFTVVNYSLGTGGTGKNLTLGGLQNQIADTGVTLSETNALLLSSKISINSTTKVITIIADVTYDELYDYVIAWNCSSAANAVIPNLTQYLLTKNGTNISAYTGWSLVINSGVTLSTGANFLSIYFPTITLNGGKITGVYQDNTGTSTVLTISGFAVGSTVYVEDNNGTQKYYNNNANGVAVIYIPPTATGLWYYAVEKFGNQRQSDFFANEGGQKSIVVKELPDNKILLSQAQISALTSIDNPDEAYDYIALLRTQTPYISFGQIVSKDGSTLYGGDYDIKIQSNAPSVCDVDYDAKLITLKTSLFEDGPICNLVKVDVPKTVTVAATETITVNIEDANGDSTTAIAGVSGNLVDVWKCLNGTINVDYATGTKIASNIGAGKFRFIHQDGYKLIFFDKNTLMARDCSMSKGTYTLGWYTYNSPQGGLDQNQSDKFDHIYSTLDVVDDNVVSIKGTVENLSSGSGATLAEIEASTVLAKEETSQSIKSVSDMILDTVFSIINTKLNDIKMVVDGIPVITDKTGYSLTNDQIEAIATAVESHLLNEGDNQMLINTIAGAIGNTNIDELALVAAIRADLERAGGKVDAIKTKVDTLQNADFTDTNQLLVDLGNPLQASDYIAPDNAKIAAIKTVVEAIKIVVDSVKTTVEDKTGYALTIAQVEAIATAVESHLLNEGDSQMLINAIVGAIGNTNIDEIALVAAIRTDLERNGGKIDSISQEITSQLTADDVKMALFNWLTTINEGIQLASNFKKHKTNLLQ